MPGRWALTDAMCWGSGGPRRQWRGARHQRLCHRRADPVRGLRPFRPGQRSPARPPTGARRLAPADLPAALRRFTADQQGLAALSRRPADPAPRIVYPPDGARVDLGSGGDGGENGSESETAAERALEPLTLKLQGGGRRFAGWPMSPMAEPSLRA